MSDYEVGTGVFVPGLEGVWEYGDSTTMRDDRIPGAHLINDRRRPDRARFESISGLHDDPDGRDTRAPKSDRNGEDAGILLYGGRTIGVTGVVESGNIMRMRDEWRNFRKAFGTTERDLIVHQPGEVKSLVNQLVNPSFEADASGWAVTADSGSPTLSGGVASDDLLVGSASVTLSGAGELRIQQLDSANWIGEDVVIMAMIKKVSGTATVTSFSLKLSEVSEHLGSGSWEHDVQATPTTGQWYQLYARIPGHLMDTVGIERLGIEVSATTSNSGTLVLQIDKCNLVVLAESDPSPTYFDGDTVGFEWDGSPNNSISRGPTYTVNQITDPDGVDQTFWIPDNDVGVVLSNGPYRTHARGSDLSDSSVNCEMTSTSSGQKMSFTMDPSHNMVVTPGRHYKLYANLYITDSEVGDIDAQIVWIDRAGSDISSPPTQSFQGTGQFVVDLAAQAPDDAFFARVAYGCLLHESTDATQSIHINVSDSCFVDVTAFDPGLFIGTSDSEIEIAADDGAHRLIPRPWLIRSVRKTSDAKAPESQSNGRATRDFTMTLRASDPRIYAIDQRRRLLELTGDPKFVSWQAPDGFSLEAGSLPVPTGWTYDSSFVTNPGGSAYNWSQDAWDSIPSGQPSSRHPNGGVGIKAWNSAGSFSTNRPASDLSTRMYRSAEGFTYGEPRVVLGCAPSGHGFTSLGDDPRQFNVVPGDTEAYTTYSNILLKRTTAPAWLELRWSSASDAYIQSLFGGTLTGSNTFELWCSHDGSGSSGATKLAGWDYQSYDSSIGLYPFIPIDTPVYLTSWIIDDVVYWEFWTSYPNPINLSSRIEHGSYPLTSDLIPIVGSGVAGNCGHALVIPKTNSQFNFNEIARHPPFVHHFESYDAGVPPGQIQIPVIGSIDTPLMMKLKGDLVDPVVTITTPSLDGSEAVTSVARFTGTILDSNPITIDLSSSSSGEILVLDSFQANASAYVIPGSRFTNFRPGINYITIQAKGWGDFDHHFEVSWRDALKSG